MSRTASHVPLAAPTATDILLDLASRMEADGGMPGPDEESRAIATVVALLAFLSAGHTATDRRVPFPRGHAAEISGVADGAQQQKTSGQFLRL
jgi:hypothetical protein